MNRYPLSNLCWFSVLAVAFCCALGQAQEPAADATTENLAPETNPAVLAALELPRTKPSDYVSAILALVDLGRPELAKPILEQLQAQKLSDAQRADLVREYGTQRMMRLERVPELAPTAGEFADACLSAAAAAARNPNQLNQLIGRLSDPSPEVRHAAMVDLESTGEPGTIALLEALAQEKDPQRRNAISEAIVHMGPEAVGPLLGILLQRGDVNDFGSDVIRILRAMQVSQAAPLIAAYSKSPDAEHLLVDAIDRYRSGVPAFTSDQNDEVALWQWCKGHLETHLVPADVAQADWMARLALELAQLRPDNRAYQEQALVLALEANFYWAPNPDGPEGICDVGIIETQKLIDSVDNRLLGDVLADAMRQRRSRAAERAVELLGEHGDSSMLYTRDGQPAPLVDALDYPDRRVRFAALAAVMQIAPTSPFPGSSRVPETLGYFARGTGERRAVVATPTIQRAANVAGRLRAAGIDAAPANRGAEAVKLAQQSPDIEFALVDMDIQAPGVRDVIYALRIDPATGHMPIGLLAGEGRLEAAQALAAEHQRVLAFSRPHSDERTAAMADQLTALAGHNDVPPDERAAQSQQAIAWLAELLDKGPTFYNLRRQSNVIQAAALRPEAPSDSLAALAALGTPAGQRALVDLASLQTIPIARRREAAQAFDQSIQEFGLLLTSDEIVRQYDRYNASATADADTQQVLGAVLDTIESQRTPLQTRSPAP